MVSSQIHIEARKELGPALADGERAERAEEAVMLPAVTV
jgi:hypothetical protein